MGASQSSQGEETSAGGQVKTSYYELLGVERNATQDELKKAYRKKALQLHPDRNYGDVERTTALFAEVRAAYEVLSDDQERAWYDAHEASILRGGTGEEDAGEHYQGNMRVTTADDLARMMGKFRGNVDFSDLPNGFFGFVRETFEQLAHEEEYAADYEDINIPNYPSFGHKEDTYDGVVRDFYAAWNGFATAKNFAWLDMYQLSHAPDRRTRRLMEKENQKLRDDGRREFNDAVRTLVAFVRKRDPRFTPNSQTDEDKAKAQRDARKAQAARARAAQIAKMEEEVQAVPEWATARPDDELDEESEEEIEEEHYECVACNKTFKSERQYDAHEKSKKHQKSIQALKKKMQKDNANLDLGQDALVENVVTLAEGHIEADATTTEMNGSDGFLEDVTEKTGKLGLGDNDTDEEEPQLMGDVSDNKATEPHTTSGPTLADGDDDDDNDDDDDGDGDDDEDDEYASRSEIEARLAGFSSKESSNPKPIEELETKSTDGTQPEGVAATQPKMGKAAQKRAKKAAKQAEAEADDSGAKMKCAGCKAGFSSKTQLHQHLKEHPGHAALKSVAGGGKKGKRR
ncbi:hypothetical protein COCMIDRAFT_10060 [Bipolaris oryzae ATCC 44560]|uniref:J domain-containing protein n=1 Tax=Bipolaris oryzae ATCC 44560 TaxID=930090 RepID=W6YQM1_COCMI|nr:uncharacterized protein COCMIDRAFT_10060 [Bipolaris oryzae ATCC 44560]EUC39960.1 hypothetical protein COCMIDRAFT_10060 [Bipolaris oryzae ATCC 44560]